MKYAIISDIHGNLSALSAVLKDAENFDVDRYIFAGDYSSYLPYPNEVVEIIKRFENAIVIQGNEDGYLAEYAKQDQSTWTDGQFQAHYWHYRAMKSINRDYLLELPKLAILKDNDVNIRVTHKSSDIYGDIEYKEFSSSGVAEKYQNDSCYSRQKLLLDIREHLCQKECVSAIDTLSDGIYIFGHTHVQWNAKVRNKIFINPGSCGLALDGALGAPYTLLTIDEHGIDITERRVLYDVDDLIMKFRNSDLYAAAPVWSNIILREIVSGYESAMFFLQFADQYANELGDTLRPFSVETWTQAYDIWSKK